MPYIVEIKNVYKTYKRTEALKDVSMNIIKGEIYGFVGENGAGKSTMIRIITNINRPTLGTVKLNTTKRLGAVAALVEAPALHKGYSAMRNLEAQCDILGIKKERSELAEYLELVGLKELVTSRKIAKNFSLGMRQRLSIAMLLIGDPEFMLLDEPMNGLDPVGIKDMRDLILRLNKEKGTTFLISSHILSELDKVATTYGFISHGVLVEEITAQDLHEKAGTYGRIVLKDAPDTKLISLLEGVTYRIEEECILIISGQEEALKVLQQLTKNDIVVEGYEIVRESIEDYYLNVIKKGVRA